MAIARVRLRFRNISFSLLIFMICLLYYLFFWSGIHYSIDGIIMFEYAKALIFQHSWIMHPPVNWNHIDFYISRWAIGQTFVYVPFLWIFSKTLFNHNLDYTRIPYNPELISNPVLFRNISYLSVSFLNAGITALTASVLYSLIRNLGFSQRKSIMGALIFGMASPAAVYAKLDFAQPLAALFLVTSFWLLVRFFQTKRKSSLFLLGFSMAGAVYARTELIFFPIPFIFVGVWLILSMGQPWYSIDTKKVGMFLWIIIPFAILIVLNQFINFLRFGEWWSVGYDTIHLIKVQILPLIGNTISPGRGLFLFYPLSCLSLFSYSRLKNNLVFWILFITAFGSIVFYSVFNDGWAAGLCWGPRLLVPFLPFFTILTLLGFEQLRNIISETPSKVIFSFLAIIGGVFTFQGLLFDFGLFYGRLNIGLAEANNGMYNFAIKYSPILSGWGRLFLPDYYDIFWIRYPSTALGLSQFVPFIVIAFELIVIMVLWIKLKNYNKWVLILDS